MHEVVVWIPLLWMATGTCLFAGVHFLAIGPSRARAPMFAAFGLTCLAVGAYIAISALMQTPGLHLPWLELERAHMALACVIYPLGVWFIALYSRLARWHGWVAAAGIIFAGALILDLAQRGSVMLAGIRAAPDLVLPWGEHVKQVVPIAAPTALLYDGATFLVFGWALWRCWALAQRADWRRAGALAAYIGLQALVTAYAEYASTHDAVGLAGLEWSALPFLLLVLLVSRTLSVELRRDATVLDSTVAALHAENLQRAQAEANLRRVAYTDAVTGLPNRRALDEWLTAALARTRRQPGAVMVIDPKRFAIINHALGHRTGDLLLREIGERLTRGVGADGYVARLSGDEFAVVTTAPEATTSDAPPRALAVAGQLREMLAATSRMTNQTLAMATHIGIAQLTPGQDAAAALRCAYAALRVAKDTDGAEPVVFTPSMEASVQRRLRLETELRSAIARRELYLVYQPQMDRTGALVGAEALVRWNHPDFGVVSPAEFVPIAENTGQMPLLGQFVLHEACTALAEFTRHGRLQLAINVSPRQLLLANFVADVEAVLHETGVEPQAITLEITETVFIQDVADAAAKINALNALGTRVSVDDFGTGHASIASLKAFEVHELKIDQTFVRDMSTTQPDRFIGAMLALARALNLRVVAEGVERVGQRDALLTMGCDVFQGFLFGRPMPAADLVWRLQHQARQAPVA